MLIRQLAGHTAGYTVASLASRGTVLVWLLVLPSFISTAEYGALGLILTAAALVQIAVPLEISQALARYYPPAAPADQRQYLRTAWTFTLAMLAIASIVAFAFARQGCELLLGSPRYFNVFRLAILFFALNTAFMFLQSSCAGTSSRASSSWRRSARRSSRWPVRSASRKFYRIYCSGSWSARPPEPRSGSRSLLTRFGKVSASASIAQSSASSCACRSPSCRRASRSSSAPTRAA